MTFDPDYYYGVYRCASARMPGRDYTEPGSYFITICTRQRVAWFGDIRNGRMELTDIGAVVDQYWREIPSHFPNVRLDEFVVMPDHMHGILTLRPRDVADHGSVGTRHWRVPTPSRVDADPPRPRLLTGSVGAIINQFKMTCTKRVRVTCPGFAWQPRFHDRIIRDDRALETTRAYVRNNPAAWWAKHSVGRNGGRHTDQTP